MLQEDLEVLIHRLQSYSIDTEHLFGHVSLPSGHEARETPFRIAQNEVLNGTKTGQFSIEQDPNIKTDWFLRYYNTRGTILAYYCPYMNDWKMTEVKIERDNPKFNFLFTGSMQGCSLVFGIGKSGTEGPNIRVFHDNCAEGNQADVYKELIKEKRIVFRLDCNGKSINTTCYHQQVTYAQDPYPNTFSFLRYINGSWHLIIQHQQRKTNMEEARRHAVTIDKNLGNKGVSVWNLEKVYTTLYPLLSIL